MSIDRDQFQAFEPNLEAKAFIYQQVQELEDEVKDLGSLSVFVEKEETIDTEDNRVLENKYAVTFVIDPENLNLKVRAESQNIFSACISAKNVAKSKLLQLKNAGSQEERAQHIEEVLDNKGYVH